MPLRVTGKRLRQPLMRQAQRRRNPVQTAQASARATDLTAMLAELLAAGATTLQAVADGLNARSIPTVFGETWLRSQVWRVLGRLGPRAVGFTARV
jgi:hypothetical protein